MNTELAELSSGVQAFAYIIDFLGNPGSGKQIPLVQTLLVDGIDDAPELLGHTESGRGIGGVVLFGTEDGVEGDVADRLSVLDQFVHRHTEAGTGIVGLDGDIVITAILQPKDNDVLENLTTGVQRVGGGIVNGK